MKKRFLIISLGLVLAAFSLNAAPRFSQSVKGDGKTVISDTLTVYDWTYDFVTGKTWQQALKYCEELNYGVYTDWKLPNINELRTLINYRLYYPATDLPNASTNYFWSSSSYASSTDSAWFMDFGYGGMYNFNKANYYAVRCMRP